jgi:hypothetical protein
MPRGVKWVLAIALTSVLLVSLTVGATVGSVFQAGVISVLIEPRSGGAISVTVPASVANMAMAAVEFVPHEALALDRAPVEALDALEHYLPAAQHALDRLAEQPDFVLVEVESNDEHVIVRKEGRSLRVVVDSDDGRVDVSIPLSTVKQFTKRLRRLSRDF